VWITGQKIGGVSCRTPPTAAEGATGAKAYLEELYRASPEWAKLAHLGREFFRIVRNRDLEA
jgi:hypothetical protein